jgi:peroxiredoxin
LNGKGAGQHLGLSDWVPLISAWAKEDGEMQVSKHLKGPLVLVFLVALLPFLAGAAPPAPGSNAPDFQLKDLQGNPVRLSTLRGKTVVLHFWATWCPHCLAEMPLLENANQELTARGAQVLAINLGEPHRKVERYAQEHGLKLAILLDTRGKAAQAFGVVGLPATVVIDPQGRVTGQIDMGSLDLGSLEKLLSQKAGEGKKPEN